MSGVLYIAAGVGIVWLFFRGSLTQLVDKTKAAAAGTITPRTDPSLGGPH